MAHALRIVSRRRCVAATSISKLSESLTALRLNKTYLTMRGRIRNTIPHLPRVGKAAYLGIDGLTSVVREMVTPHTFFENLGVRYIGPIDGHDIESLENTLKSASEWDGPILVHVLTTKGLGYEPAIDDDLKMHDYKLPPRHDLEEVPPQSFSQAFSDALVALASADDRIVAITAAMAGPTGLLNGDVVLAALLVRQRHQTVGRRGRHGDGRTQARRRGLLDLLLARLRSGPSRRRTVKPARGVRL